MVYQIRSYFSKFKNSQNFSKYFSHLFSGSPRFSHVFPCFLTWKLFKTQNFSKFHCKKDTLSRTHLVQGIVHYSWWRRGERWRERKRLTDLWELWLMRIRDFLPNPFLPGKLKNWTRAMAFNASPSFTELMMKRTRKIHNNEFEPEENRENNDIWSTDQWVPLRTGQSARRGPQWWSWQDEQLMQSVGTLKCDAIWLNQRMKTLRNWNLKWRENIGLERWYLNEEIPLKTRKTKWSPVRARNDSRMCVWLPKFGRSNSKTRKLKRQLPTEWEMSPKALPFFGGGCVIRSNAIWVGIWPWLLTITSPQEVLALVLVFHLLGPINQ